MIPSKQCVALAGLLMTMSVGTQAHEAVQPSSGQQEQKQHHHHNFPATINEFHHTLAQLWHARPGPERSQAICERAAHLRTLAYAVETAPPPQSVRDHSAGWSEAAKNMVASVDHLVTVCAGPGSAESEQALGSIHQAFHGIIAYLGPRH